jgi:hypothetical protein
VLLIHIDPPQRIGRWYSVEITPTLFETGAVVCRWGSRRTAPSASAGESRCACHSLNFFVSL